MIYFNDKLKMAVGASLYKMQLSKYFVYSASLCTTKDNTLHELEFYLKTTKLPLKG